MLLENFEGLVWEVFFMVINEYEVLYTEYV